MDEKSKGWINEMQAEMKKKRKHAEKMEKLSCMATGKPSLKLALEKESLSANSFADGIMYSIAIFMRRLG